MPVKITKGMFEAYEMVRQSGETNMFDLATVISLAEDFGATLTKENCHEIMKNYTRYKNKFTN